MTDHGNEAIVPESGLSRFLLRHRAFVVVWLALFVSIAGVSMVSPLLPVFVKEMGASGIWLGLAFSGFAISQIPLMLIIGRLSDRFGKRTFVWLGLLIFSLTAIGYIFAPGYHEIVLLRVVSGVGSALVIPTAFAYVGELAPPGHEGRYMGLFNVALITGFGLGPLMGGLVHDAFGMNATFISMSLLSGIGFVVAYLFLPGGARAAGGGELSQPSTSFAGILKDNTMRGVVTFQMVLGLSLGAVLSFLGIYMTSVMGTTLALVGVVMSVRALQNGLLAYPFGWLADRANRVVMVAAGMTVMAAGTFSIPWIGSFALLLGVFMAMGVFEGAAGPAINAITVDRGRTLGMGSVMGVFQTAMSFGLIVGSVAGGLIEDSYGVDWVFRYAAGLSLLGVPVFIMFMRRAAAPRAPGAG